MSVILANVFTKLGGQLNTFYKVATLYKVLLKRIVAGITSLCGLALVLYINSVVSGAVYETTDKIAEQQLKDNPQLKGGYDTARAVDDAVSTVEDAKETTLEVTKMLAVIGVPAAAISGFVIKQLK